MSKEPDAKMWKSNSNMYPFSDYPDVTLPSAILRLRYMIAELWHVIPAETVLDTQRTDELFEMKSVVDTIRVAGSHDVIILLKCDRAQTKQMPPHPRKLTLGKVW